MRTQSRHEDSSEATTSAGIESLVRTCRLEDRLWYTAYRWFEAVLGVATAPMQSAEHIIKSRCCRNNGPYQRRDGGVDGGERSDIDVPEVKPWREWHREFHEEQHTTRVELNLVASAEGKQWLRPNSVSHVSQGSGVAG